MIKTIANTKKDRINGLGPKRNELVTFAKIGEISDILYNELNDIADRRTGNDLNSKIYEASNYCQLKGTFNTGDDSYRLVLLQETDENKPSTTEYDYYKYNEEFSPIPFFKNVYRLRISEMKKNHILPWHIDICPSVCCRAQICLNENDSVFQFNRRGNITELQMKPKEIWFINVGWSHQVINKGDIRRGVVFGFKYDDYIGDISLKL